MGIVYLATDTRLARPVALKVLDVYEIPDKEKKSRFLYEAQSAAAIRHPNIATIYEVGETAEGMPFIAMEFCEGVTLSQLLRRGAVDGTKFLHIARQIAEGVAAAHRNGIVHRDIKSANIVLQDDDTVKILDFGLAKRFDGPLAESQTAKYTSTGSSFFGTLPYISPEQAQGQPADRRSDLFSIGVVLYELATGRLPFDDESPLVVLEKIRDAEPAPFTPIDSNFPADAANVISALLQKNPDDRYQTADELAADLLRIQREQSPTGPSPSQTHSGGTMRFGRTVRRAPRSNRWIWASAIVAVLLLAGVAALLYRKHQQDTKAALVDARTPIRSLAVLPFQNLSGGSGDSFLSIGLADALVTRLQQSSSLQVRPTSAVVDYQKQSDVNAKAAAADLQVDGVLEGRFISSGSTIRVNLQLTDGRTGYGVWAASVDGNRADLITLIDNVSTRTSSALSERLGSAMKTEGHSEPHTTVPEAYENYLKARALIGTLVPAQIEQEIGYLKRAVALDPNFAAAYADLAIAIVLRKVRGFSTDAHDFEEAERYARQAVRLDANLASAHLALGRVLVRDPSRFRESVRENLAAIRLNPKDLQSLYTMVTYFVATGEAEKATCVANLMAQIDPKSNDVRSRGYFTVNAVDPEGALQDAKDALAHPETALAGHDISGLAYLMQGNVDAAEAEQREVSRLVPNHYLGKSLRAMIEASRGNVPAMEAAIASFRNDAETNHWAAVRVALCYAKVGNRAKTVEWLDKAANLGNHSWYYFIKHPWLQSMQSDPDFTRIVSKMKSDLDDVRDDVIGVYQLICQDKGPVA